MIKRSCKLVFDYFFFSVFVIFGLNTEDIAYMIIYGLGAAASTRVSNELGAANVSRAKNAMVLTLKLSVLLSITVVLTLAFGHNIWARFLSNSSEITKEFASLTPFVATSMAVDPMQGVLLGLYMIQHFWIHALQCDIE
ncbi:hypothetical protein Patl1_04690 [Pistacia atlantica]|uniref:Uncharacterized protein n=1 Tax=Pistacia atlantica TaxID=434234 RepID=A0ACC1BVH1_9ROSI|nr:hypothetical protein Patl1_04690 [Pistacia atlantica]